MHPGHAVPEGVVFRQHAPEIAWVAVNVVRSVVPTSQSLSIHSMRSRITSIETLVEFNIEGQDRWHWKHQGESGQWYNHCLLCVDRDGKLS